VQLSGIKKTLFQKGFFNGNGFALLVVWFILLIRITVLYLESLDLRWQKPDLHEIFSHNKEFISHSKI
jgi:uncharacterized protein (TIGR01732 family)